MSMSIAENQSSILSNDIQYDRINNNDIGYESQNCVLRVIDSMNDKHKCYDSNVGTSQNKEIIINNRQDNINLRSRVENKPNCNSNVIRDNENNLQEKKHFMNGELSQEDAERNNIHSETLHENGLNNHHSNHLDKISKTSSLNESTPLDNKNDNIEIKQTKFSNSPNTIDSTTLNGHISSIPQNDSVSTQKKSFSRYQLSPDELSNLIPAQDPLKAKSSHKKINDEPDVVQMKGVGHILVKRIDDLDTIDDLETRHSEGHMNRKSFLDDTEIEHYDNNNNNSGNNNKSYMSKTQVVVLGRKSNKKNSLKKGNNDTTYEEEYNGYTSWRANASDTKIDYSMIKFDFIDSVDVENYRNSTKPKFSNLYVMPVSNDNENEDPKLSQDKYPIVTDFNENETCNQQDILNKDNQQLQQQPEQDNDSDSGKNNKIERKISFNSDTNTQSTNLALVNNFILMDDTDSKPREKCTCNIF